MKNYRNLLGLLLLFVAFSITSCDYEPIDSAIDVASFNNSNTGNPLFRAEFGGQTFIASETVVNLSNNKITIVAKRGSLGEAFNMEINGITVGLYQTGLNPILYNPANSLFGFSSINTANPTQNTGIVQITSINTVAKTISGKFNFTGYWNNPAVTNVSPVVFSNGIFTNLKYN